MSTSNVPPLSDERPDDGERPEWPEGWNGPRAALALAIVLDGFRRVRADRCSYEQAEAAEAMLLALIRDLGAEWRNALHPRSVR